MRSFGFVTFVVGTVLCGLPTRAPAANWTLTPCSPVAKAREAARSVETDFYNQVRWYNQNISLIDFQRMIDQIEWSESRGEFVTEEALPSTTIMGWVRVTVSCGINQGTGQNELRPEISFEPRNSSK
jgi:hypothetical protein